MTLNAEQIEWIVSEVVRRLRALSLQEDGARTAATGSTGNELMISDRVITLRSLEGKLSGVSRVLVRQKAVITPAVKDELRAKRIELVLQT